MLKRKLAGLILAVTVFNLVSTPATTFASEIKEVVEKSKDEDESKEKYSNINANKFGLYGSNKLESYNDVFKVANTEIKTITNNGGKYGSSTIDKAIDGNFSTHWETGKPNSSSFINEVVIELNEKTELNRIVYGARQDGAKGKGFAQKFEIYSSVSENDDYELVSKGNYNGSTGDIVEFKFEPTEFKKIKFKFIEANQNWASSAEFMLYKQDKIDENMAKLFVDNTMAKVSEEFKSEEKLNDLAEKAKKHPLHEEYKDRIDLAREILKTGDEIANTIWELESRGNSIKESQKRRLWNFQDWQPTGYKAKSGEIVNVYVDVEEGKPAPSLVFKQMDSQHNGQVVIPLKNGKNVITIPELSSDQLRPGTAKAGVLYTSNPYTKEEQGRKPKIRIEANGNYPHYIKGVDNDDDVMKELEDYVELLKKDSTLPDVFEVFSDKALVNVRATYALQWYKENNKLPSYTANESDKVIKETMDFWGFDGSSEVHSDFNFRYVSMLKWLDNGGFMNAGNGITGFNLGSQGGALNVDMGWGFAHEMGHNFDTNNRSIGEVTNNILPLHFQKLNGIKSKISEQNLWESKILLKVALDDYSNNEYYPESDKSLLTHIAPLWQLQLYNEEFWPKFEKAFRESEFKGGSWEDKHNEWVKVASDIFKLDLYEHFNRHGMVLRESTKEYTAKYEKPSKKLWYINDNIYVKDGGKFTEKVNYEIKSIKTEGNTIRLNFDINEKDKENLLGYEIFRDGKTIGFTGENTFIDKTATVGSNHEYKVVAYDLEVNPKKEAALKVFAPIINSQEHITVELNSKFDPMDYVMAVNHQGESIKNEVKVIKNNVDLTKNGVYEVTYEVTSNGETKVMSSSAEVVSEIDYLSDMSEVSSIVGWGSFRKDKSPGGKGITLFKDGLATNFTKGLGAHAASELIYNIENKGYNSFRAYAGIDGEVGLNKGLATFEVYADGKKVYDSGKVKSGEDYKAINIDITGVKELKLVTTDGGNGITGDNTVWAEAKLTTNNSKPTIIAEDVKYKLGDNIDLMVGVTAKDSEDGDLTSKITIKESNFEKDKLGKFNITYEVKDSDNNIVSKTINLTVYGLLDVKKSHYGTIGDLNKYKELFNIPVSTVTNNGGKYGGSVVEKAIDGSLESHFETGKPNSDSFKNEVIFTLNELTAIEKMAYGSRRGGKGFATKFDIEVSETIDENDFYKVGEGSYSGSINDIIEINLNGVKARRVKFIFVEAYANWASIGEVGFYKEDTLANKVLNDLFVDLEESDINEKYNSLEKLENLRTELKNHPAYNIFEERLSKAEELVKAKFPTLEIPKDISTKVGNKLDLNEKYSASDKEDGDITSKVKVTGKDKVNYNKPGTYEVKYHVKDSDGNEATKIRNVHVVDMDDYKYLSDTQWKSVHNTYGKFEKDIAISKNPLRLTGDNNEIVTYEKGLGSHSTATAIYDLTKIDAQYFTSFIGVDRAMYNSVGSVGFQVFLDNEKVYDSGVMRSTDKQKFVEVELSGAKELKLVINDGGNGNGSDHANWADAKLHYANENGKVIDRSDLDSLLEDMENLNKEDYVEETWNNLIEIKNKVLESLKDGYNQKEVNDLYEELKVAKEGLQEVVKYDSLIELVESTKGFKEYLYYKENWKNLIDIVKKAEDIIANKNSTAEEMKAMTNELKISIDGMKIREEKLKLEKLVEFSETLTDISVVGAEKHQETRWYNFVTIRDKSRQSLLDPNMSDKETKDSIRSLEYFIEDLELKQ